LARLGMSANDVLATYAISWLRRYGGSLADRVEAHLDLFVDAARRFRVGKGRAASGTSKHGAIAALLTALEIARLNDPSKVSVEIRQAIRRSLRTPVVVDIRTGKVVSKFAATPRQLGRR
jgi:hypothetical protein